MPVTLIIGIILGSLLFIMLIVYFAISAGIVVYLQKPKKRDIDFLIDYETREKKFDKTWLDIRYEPYTMNSKFGYNLFGRYYENSRATNKTMISLHGHNSCSISQLKYLNMFLDLGFNVFIPDHRRSGFSDGNSITFGHYEKYDVIAWMDLLEEKLGKRDFYIFGESMGGATAVMVTALDKRIKLLIDYCGYYDIKNILKGHIKNEALVSFIYPGISIMTMLLTRTNYKECAAGKYLSKVDVPVLFLHSRADEIVIFKNFEKKHATKDSALTHVFTDTKHARSMVEEGDAFRAVVSKFILDNTDL